jgi:hypothetical protein
MRPHYRAYGAKVDLFSDQPTGWHPYLNRLGLEDAIFVREGSTKRRANLLLIEEMRQCKQVASFDERLIPELNSEVIDFRAASELFKPIHKLARPELHTLEILTNYQGRTVSTVEAFSYSGLVDWLAIPTHGSKWAGYLVSETS